MTPHLTKLMEENRIKKVDEIYITSEYKHDPASLAVGYKAGFTAAVEEMEKIIQEVVWTAQNVLAHEIDSKNGDDDGSIFSQRRITQDFKDLKLALAKVRKVKND